MNTKEALIAARALIEKGWCQGSFAFNVHNEPVAWFAPEAAKHCLRGACHRIAFGTEAKWVSDSDLHDRVYAALKEAGYESMVEFNDADGRTQQEVLALFDKAIEAQP